MKKFLLISLLSILSINLTYAQSSKHVVKVAALATTTQTPAPNTVKSASPSIASNPTPAVNMTVVQLQALDHRISLLEAQVDLLQKQIAINNNVTATNRDNIQQLRLKVEANKPNQLQRAFNEFKQTTASLLIHEGTPLLIGIGILAILLIIWLILPSSKNDSINDAEGVVDDEDEYDFMGSVEGIPAKLDLARAYVDMDDFLSAEKVLADVLENGTAAQKKDAKKILAKITSKTKK